MSGAAMNDFRLAPKFPAVSFLSHAEFDSYCEQNSALDDARYAHELELATRDAAMMRDGTCAPCLRQTNFTAATQGGETQPDGRILPNWREQMTCDCEDGLGARLRAILHFLAGEAGLQPWMRALWFGTAPTLERRLAQMTHEVVVARRLQMSARLPADAQRSLCLPFDSAAFHLAVSSDYLQRVPALDVALAELRRILVPGGQLVFTVPFHCRSTSTTTRAGLGARREGRLPAEMAADIHAIGWDILPRLRQAGFAQAAAHVYWSRELGYLGPFNTMFSAVV